MCDYQGYEFGASYPDSVCLDGYLWDADSGDAAPDGDGWLYTHGGDLPCPKCNHDEWLESAREGIEELGWIAADEGKPESSCPHTAMRMLFPDDRETVIAWWRKGYASRVAEAVSVS